MRHVFYDKYIDILEEYATLDRNKFKVMLIKENIICSDNTSCVDVFNTDVSYITVTKDLGRVTGGKSTKVDNFLVYPSKIINNLPSILLTIGGSFTGEIWVFVLSLLVTLQSIQNLMEVNLSKQTAMIYYYMWVNRDSQSKLEVDSAYELLKEYLLREEAYYISEYTIQQFYNDLDVLQQLRVIREENGKIELIEEVILNNED